MSCSKPPSPEPGDAPAVPRSITPLPHASADILRANLTAGGVRTEYASFFEASQLTRIVEHRHVDDAVLEGEYVFKGARLLRYRGTTLADAQAIDLQFDMQGVLQENGSRNFSDDDVRTIRDRAQLLRSHALAQRASRMHQSGS